MSESKIDMKETTELVKALIELPIDIGVELKDGFQFDDVIRLAPKLATKPVYIEGLKGIGQVIPELKDLQIEEVIALLLVTIMAVPKIVDAFKKGELHSLLKLVA